MTHSQTGKPSQLRLLHRDRRLGRYFEWRASEESALAGAGGSGGGEDHAGDAVSAGWNRQGGAVFVHHAFGDAGGTRGGGGFPWVVAEGHFAV